MSEKGTVADAVNADVPLPFKYPVNVVAPLPPFATAIVVPFQTPVAIVPTLVSEDAVTPAANVAPVSVPAAAVTVMFAVPSNEVPFIVLAVCNAVAVPAFPVTLV